MFWLVVAFFILAPCACFLVLAVSPRLFDQGTQWFTLQLPARTPSPAATAVALVNSIWVSCAAAGARPRARLPDRLGWRAARRSRRGGSSPAACGSCCCCPPGCRRSAGCGSSSSTASCTGVGLNLPFVTHAILGPFGVVLLLGLRCVPFAFLAITAALAGLGQEFEDAARVHGASRLQAIRLVDADPRARDLVGARDRLRRVGQRLRRRRDARLQARTSRSRPTSSTQAINNFPPSFPTAAAMAWLLVASVALPLVLQARALRGRSYAVLSGRTPPGRAARAHAPRPRARGRRASRCFFVVALGDPRLRRGQRLAARRLRRLVQPDLRQLPRRSSHNADLLGPLERSLEYGAIAASFTVVAGFVAARLLTRRADARDAAARLPAPRRGRAAERRLRGRLHPRLQPADPLARSASTSTRRRRCCSSPTSPRACRRTRASSSAPSPSSKPRSTTRRAPTAPAPLRAWLRGRPPAHLASRS